MEKNVGRTDRIVRFILGAGAIGFGIYLSIVNFSWLPIFLFIIGGILTWTGICQKCFLYETVKISTYQIPLSQTPSMSPHIESRDEEQIRRIREAEERDKKGQELSNQMKN